MNHIVFIAIAVFCSFAKVSTVAAAFTNDQQCIDQAKIWQNEIDSKFKAPTSSSESDADTNDVGPFKGVSRPTTIGNDDVRLSKSVMYVYTLDGRECYRSHQRIKEGDLIYFGVFGKETELKEIRGREATCGIQTPDAAIYDASGGVKIETLDAGNMFEEEKLGIHSFRAFECFGDPLEFEVSKGGTVLFTTVLRQFPRYRATFQIGNVFTTLGDRTYSTADYGDGSVVRVTSNGSRGPLYVGSLVLYGLPRYFESFGGGGNYAGRDIVNENKWQDALGLAISIGLSKPTETFGLGLSFEIARGFNITLSRLFRRVEVLDGINAGDPFDVSNGQTIPVKERWENETVLGLSIDSRYLSNFFN